MTRKLYVLMLTAFCLFFNTRLFADVTLTSSAVAASNIAQGTSSNIVYIVKMDITSLPVLVNSIQFTLTGTHDNNDLTSLGIYFNPTAPSLTGATALAFPSALFAAPHPYNIGISQSIAAGGSGYFIITVTTAAGATNGNTVKLDGAANPVTFGFTTAPTITNNQTDIAGTQTILAAGATLTSSAVAASNIAQGTSSNIVYIVKMDITSLPVLVNSIQFTLTGTHDNNDLTSLGIYFNPTAPSLTGATALAFPSALFAAPHPYNIGISQSIAAGGSGYFIITVTTAAGATNGNTVKLDGAANPVTFGFTTAPTITNNQTDIAGTQTILAAGATLTSSAVAASNIAQGTSSNIVYIVKMDITSLPVLVNSIQFTLTGTHDNNDLTSLGIYFNPTAPSLTGATALAFPSALFAAPHPYNIGISQSIAAGGSGYFIITVTTAAGATNGNTVKLDGAANPVTFGFTTAPTITNNQTDIAGTQTILAAGATLTSSAVAASNIAQGTSSNIVYIVKMDITSLPVLVNSIQFTLTGTHDNNDLTSLGIYFNPTAPSLTGATALAFPSALFAAPHPYNIGISQSIAAGGSGYFIITVTTAAGATNGNTVKLDGAANPVTFGFTTAPTITNNQTDIAGTQTILAAGATLTSSAVAASNIAQGTSSNIVYIVKMDITSLPVLVNSIQFTLTGTHDNNDLTSLGIYFNPTAPSLTGATALAFPSALFAAPHPYNIGISQSIAAGGSGYFIITVTTAAGATNGNTVKLDGAANPVTFGFTTAPTITNNQTDIAGTQTILAAGATLTSSAVAASNIAQGTSSNIVYIVKMDITSLPVLVNSIQFTLTGTHDNNDLTSLGIYFNPTAPSLTGATALAFPSALFAAPHPYNIGISQSIAAGGSGYFIITVTTAAGATNGNTVKLDGAANPVTFGFTTAPTITNNQTDIAGTQTILAAGATLTSSAVAASNIAQGTSSNIVYIVKMDITSLPVLVNSIQFTLTGTHDNNDLTSLGIYFNPTAPSLTGATALAFPSALFAAPHPYNIGISQSIAAGGSGYFIITVTTAAGATIGNTVKLDGALNPVTFGFTTAPPVTNNQTDVAGAQTIFNPLPLTLKSFTGNLINKQDAQLQWTTATELNTKDFEIEWSENGQLFTYVAIKPAAGNSAQDLHYSYIHKMPVDGNNYYRLKMADKDGRFTYSPVIKIYINLVRSTIGVFPNPVNDLLNIQIQSVKNETILFQLHSVGGEIIASKSFTVTKGSNRLFWNMKHLAIGNYFISSGKQQFETIKIIKN